MENSIIKILKILVEQVKESKDSEKIAANIQNSEELIHEYYVNKVSKMFGKKSKEICGSNNK